MASNTVRKLSPEELALVCGGTTLPTLTVTGSAPEYYWPDWPDNAPPDFSDPWDYSDPYGGGGGGGGDSQPTLEDLKADVEADPEFQELAPRLQEVILNNPKLLTAIHDFLSAGKVFDPTTGLGAYVGSGILVNDHAYGANANPSDADILRFIHEVGHHVAGVPDSRTMPPDQYALERAQGEVHASIFAVTIANESGLEYVTIGYLQGSDPSKVANGTFTSADFDRAVGTVLNDTPRNLTISLADIPDYNGNGEKDNIDLYLSQWVGANGESYTDWVNSQNSGGGGGGGGGDGGGGSIYEWKYGWQP
jgi:hypothetical protein